MVLPALLRRTWKRLDRRAGHALAAGVDTDFHDTREAAKLARYTAETLAAPLGAPAVRLGQLAKDIQTVLGDHQDSAVARACSTTSPRTRHRPSPTACSTQPSTAADRKHSPRSPPCGRATGEPGAQCSSVSTAPVDRAWRPPRRYRTVQPDLHDDCSVGIW